MNAHKPTDSLELMTLVATGDPEARRQLVERLHSRVRTIAMTILGNALDAEDAAQSILIEILDSARTYRGDHLLGWADRIAVRTAMRHARQRRVRAAHYEPQADLDDLAGRAPEPPFGQDLPRPIVAYLAELPEARRVALVLRHVMDYSIDEIADLTSTSPNTVKDRLLHAREHMRRLIRRDLALSTVRGRMS